MLSLNAIIKRIEGICLNRPEIASFYYAMPTDILNEKKIEYATVFLQDMPGTIDLTAKTDTINFKLFALDLVHVSEDAKSNETEVLSNMRGVVKDIISLINDSAYTDWKISASNPVTLVREQLNDLIAGATIDFAIVLPYDQDKCSVPKI